jgi:hypothetical protein
MSSQLFQSINLKYRYLFNEKKRENILTARSILVVSAHVAEKTIGRLSHTLEGSRGKLQTMGSVSVRIN